jgi:predicted transcriptional regulator of viral defense system
MGVFSTMDICRLMGTTPTVTRVYAHRMKEKGLLLPIHRGIYSITEDPFVIASQMEQPAYLSFSTAMYIHGRYSQVINDLFVSTSGRTRRVSFLGYKCHFVHFDGKMMFGFRREAKSNSFVMIADLEKAVIDCLDNTKYLPISDCFTALKEGFDKKRLEEYAISTGSEAILRRTGFLIESLGEDTALSPSTKTVYTLNPSLKRKGSFDPKWKLYVNEAF